MRDAYDFAIVGGGASGIYSAWRLAHASPEEVARIRAEIGGEGPLRICLFEMSDRIGGRLLSASPRSLPHLPMELGGMRYLDDHRLVKGLIETRLGLGTHLQVVDSPDNLAWLRSEKFRLKHLCERGTGLPYNMTSEERRFLATPNEDGSQKSPADLIFWAVFKEFPELRDMPRGQIRQWLRTEAQVDGHPLYQVGFWNLLARHLTHEARQFAIKTMGYDCLGGNANAVDIIAENLDFTPGSKYHLLDEGFETVLWELEKQFQAAGGQIVFGREFESFVESDTKDIFQLEFWNETEDQREFARVVVLAMPQAAIRNLRKQGPVLNPEIAPEVQTYLNAVTGIPLYKLFVIYDRPWWYESDPALSAGRSVTDLPVRQCYYWHTDPEGGPSAIMAYNDEASVSFWGGYQVGPLGPNVTAPIAAPGMVLFQPVGPEDQTEIAHYTEIERRRRKNWRTHRAPAEMVEEMHRQLMEIHQVDEAPEPIDAAFMDWMNLPYGGAVHFWNPGNQSWVIRDRIVQPVDGVQAYIIGEAWSTVQTWVEGAFQTAEIFLQSLGMAEPDWAEPVPSAAQEAALVAAPRMASGGVT